MIATKLNTFIKDILKWKYTKYFWLAIVVISALIAISAEVWVTRNGSGTGGDSIYYMQGASSFLSGNGFTRQRADGQAIPITHFPPGYSIALAGMGLLGLSPFDAGRILNVALFGVNIILVGVLIHRATRSGLLAILGAWLFMYAQNIVIIHSWIMAEPLFIFLSLMSFVFFDLYIRRKNMLFLILGSLLVGFASLTRYVGLALIPAVTLAVLLLSQDRPSRRWGNAALVGLISLAPFASWLWHNAQYTGSVANRQLIYHPITKDLIFVLFNEISSWWFYPSLNLPYRFRWSLLALFIIIGTGIYIYKIYQFKRNADVEPVSPISGMVLLFGISYLVALLLNTSFVDFSTDEQSIKRYVIPLVAVGIIWVFSTYSLIGSQGWKKMVNYSLLIVVGLGMTLFYASKSVPFILHPGTTFGYTDNLRHWPCEVNLLKSLDEKQALVTNDYELFYFLAGRPAYQITGQYDPSLGGAAQNYEEGKDTVQNMLQNGAILAALGDPNQYSAEVNGLIADMNLRIVKDCSHLRLYAVKAKP